MDSQGVCRFLLSLGYSKRKDSNPARVTINQIRQDVADTNLIIMAEIKPMALIESMKKKVCMHSDVYFRTNKVTGKTTTGKLCNPSDKAPSAAQTAAKSRFAKVVAAVRTILTDATEKAKLQAEFKAQTKIGSLFGYAMHKLNGNYDANGDLIE